ncbi:MAG: SPFH domain-containing protein, partial [Rhodanobacteraceae bacterium]
MKYAIPIVLLVLVFLGTNSIYVVGEGHAAVLSRLGRVEAAGVGPGLHLKVPFAQNVTVYDTRELSSQAEPGD